jgi:phosphatidylglycerophosphate synthase
MMQSKALSLPNLLTYARIIMVPVVAGLVMWGGAFAHWLALGIFIIAAITDFFDGWLARRWQLQSSLGRMLDPIADKLLVAAAPCVRPTFRPTGIDHQAAAQHRSVFQGGGRCVARPYPGTGADPDVRVVDFRLPEQSIEVLGAQ